MGMENNNNNNNMMFETQAKAKEGKPPTRLQKRAPAFLQLDQAASNINNNPFSPCSDIAEAIPLLSPLVLSPQPLPEIIEKRLLGRSATLNNDDNDNVNRSGATSPPGGWQHPAVPATFTEPSTMFTLFQSQCLLVDHVQ